MKPFFYAFLVIIAFSVNVQADPNSSGDCSSYKNWCKEMCSSHNNYSDKNNSWNSCSQVQWGAGPATNYLSHTKGDLVNLMPAKDSESNDIPGRFRIDENGEKKPLSFARKVIDQAAKFNDPAVNEWIRKKWLPTLYARPTSESWHGDCDRNSALFGIPELAGLVAFIPKSVVCNGEYYSKGELNTLLVTFFGETTPLKEWSLADKSKASGMLAPSSGNEMLSSLGVLGNGSGASSPEALFENLKAEHDANHSAVIEIDPSRVKWNKTVFAVWMASYEQLSSLKKTFILSTADFEGPEAASLRAIEKQMIDYAQKGFVNFKDVAKNICLKMQKFKPVKGFLSAEEDCDHLKALEEKEVADWGVAFQALKGYSVRAKLIQQTDPNLSVEQREYMFEYAVKGDFLDNRNTVEQSTYSSAIIRDGNKNIVRSSWISKPGKAEYPIFDKIKIMSSVEDNNTKYNNPNSDQTTNDGSAPFRVTNAKAFEIAKAIVKSCHSADRPDVTAEDALGFYNLLTQATFDNEISASELADLKKSYQANAAMVDLAALKESYFNSESGWRVGNGQQMYDALKAIQ